MTDRLKNFQQILVTDITVQNPDTYQGRTGMTREMTPATRGADITDVDIDEIIDDLIDFLNLRADRFNLRYSLEVKALTEASAKAKTRAFLRIKNPFEPRVTTIESKGKAGYTVENPLMSVYKITARVEKR